MDYNTISCFCSVAGQTGAVNADAKEKIHAAAGERFKDGYRRFLIALTGEATLLFAEAALSFREQYPDMGIDILIPFDGWLDEQPDSARYKGITALAESVNFSCPDEYEDSVEICNTQLIGFGRCTVVIHDDGDEAMIILAAETREAEQDVMEILI